MLVLKKTLCQQAVPQITELRKLLRSCNALFQLAEALSQDALQQTLESIISFLCAWFDFEEQTHGILLPGNEELDNVKAQYMELPNLLRRVCSSSLLPQLYHDCVHQKLSDGVPQNCSPVPFCCILLPKVCIQSSGWARHEELSSTDMPLRPLVAQE